MNRDAQRATDNLLRCDVTKFTFSNMNCGFRKESSIRLITRGDDISKVEKMQSHQGLAPTFHAMVDVLQHDKSANFVGIIPTPNVKAAARFCNAQQKRSPEAPFLLFYAALRRMIGACETRGLTDERLFDHVVTRRVVAAFLEAQVVEQLARVAQHVRAAAQHDAVVFERETRHAEVGE